MSLTFSLRPAHLSIAKSFTLEQSSNSGVKQSIDVLLNPFLK